MIVRLFHQIEVVEFHDAEVVFESSKIVNVDLDVLVPLFWKIFFWKNCLYGAFIYTKTTINTCVWIDI